MLYTRQCVYKFLAMSFPSFTYAASGKCDGERSSNRLRASHNTIDKIFEIYWLTWSGSSSGASYKISNLMAHAYRGHEKDATVVHVAWRRPRDGVAVGSSRSDCIVRAGTCPLMYASWDLKSASSAEGRLMCRLLCHKPTWELQARTCRENASETGKLCDGERERHLSVMRETGLRVRGQQRNSVGKHARGRRLIPRWFPRT